MNQEEAFLDFITILSDMLSAVACDHANGGSMEFLDIIEAYLGERPKEQDLVNFSGISSKERAWMKKFFKKGHVKVLFPYGPLFSDGTPRAAELHAKFMSGEFGRIHSLFATGSSTP